MKCLREIPIRGKNKTEGCRPDIRQPFIGKYIMTFANVEGQEPSAAGSRGQSEQQRVLLQIEESGDAIVLDLCVIVIAQ